MPQCLARASRSRQAWHRRPGRAIHAASAAGRERAAAELNAKRRYFDADSHALHFDSTFMQCFGRQHAALQQFVDGALVATDMRVAAEVRVEAWQRLKAGWSSYYAEVGDGDEACNHFTRAAEAAGAIISRTRRHQPALRLNCVLFALGPFIGAMGAVDGEARAQQHRWHSSSAATAETFNRALCGFIRQREGGGNEAVMTVYWRTLLAELGLDPVAYPIAGDVVCYTLRKEWLSPPDNEFAVHFGVVVAPGCADASSSCSAAPSQRHAPPADSASSRAHILVESKSGYAFETYVHPLHVIDPTYLIEAPAMGVHFFRPGPRAPLPMDALERLEAQYMQRLAHDHGFEAGR